MDLLSVSGVSQHFESDGEITNALRDVDFQIAAGEFVCLVGPSGCGKSTLLSMLAGMLRPSSGELRYAGELITKPVPDKIGMVFQEANLMPWLSAIDNVAFPLKLRGSEKRQRLIKAARMLHLIGLQGFEQRLPKELSGGMKQRVSIARGLVQDPDVLLLDEPFAALDEQTRLLLADELLRIWREARKTIVFVTHSLNEAVYLATRILVLSHRPGRVVDDIPVELGDRRDLAVMASPGFLAIKERVWRHIRHTEVRDA